MNKKNEKGFTLILSLVLLLVMSLMGGSLIVIASGDHRMNNTSDEYQQTFYVAEAALMEAEKSIINKAMGEWVDANSYTLPTGLSTAERNSFEEYRDDLQENAISGFARDTINRGMPRNTENISQTDCYRSFKNINRPDRDLEDEDPMRLRAIEHQDGNFGDLIGPIFVTTTAIDALNSDAVIRERAHMLRFRYEYFTINVGQVDFKGTGSSIKKSATNVQTQGTAYRIYGCGIMVKKVRLPWDAAEIKEDEFNEQRAENDIEILIPLESLVILSN